MYISTHTVAHHLRQAFRKLSIASRVELTRIVIEQAADGSLAGRVRAWSPWLRLAASTTSALPSGEAAGGALEATVVA